MPPPWPMAERPRSNADALLRHAHLRALRLGGLRHHPTRRPENDGPLRSPLLRPASRRSHRRQLGDVAHQALARPHQTTPTEASSWLRIRSFCVLYPRTPKPSLFFTPKPLPFFSRG